MNITGKTTIEELITALPEAAQYLSQRGIRWIRCGEPIWGTLESAAQEKGFSQKDIDGFIGDLKRMDVNNNQQ